MAFAFEKSLVYRKAIDSADCITSLTRKLPRGHGFLADQPNRASVSVAANRA
mgnify:CR=1 FL=1